MARWNKRSNTTASQRSVSHKLQHTFDTEYTWTNVHLAPFEVHGLIAIRAPDRRPRFNIPQRFMLRQRGGMDWHKRYTKRVESLSLNVLLSYSSLKQPLSSIALYRSARGREVSIVQAFAQDCLCSMAQQGAWIPLEALDTWWEEYAAEVRG